MTIPLELSFLFCIFVSNIKISIIMNTKKVQELREMADELINCGNSKEIAEGNGILRAIEYLTVSVEEEQVNKLGEYLMETEDDEGNTVPLSKQREILIKVYETEDETQIIDWIDNIQVVELYEYRLTVKDILTHIGYL